MSAPGKGTPASNKRNHTDFVLHRPRRLVPRRNKSVRTGIISWSVASMVFCPASISGACLAGSFLCKAISRTLPCRRREPAIDVFLEDRKQTLFQTKQVKVIGAA